MMTLRPPADLLNPSRSMIEQNWLNSVLVMWITRVSVNFSTINEIQKMPRYNSRGEVGEVDENSRLFKVPPSVGAAKRVCGQSVKRESSPGTTGRGNTLRRV